MRPNGKNLSELAGLINAALAGDASCVITGVSSPEEAKEGDIVLISDKKYLKLLKTTNASAIIVKEGEYDRGDKNLLLAKNPQLAFARVLEIFRPTYMPAPGVHPKAQVSASAKLGKDVSVQAFAVIEDGAEIGDNAIIFPNAYIGKDARIGAGAIIYPGASIREGTVIGSRVIVHSNAVIGSDGFGYAKEGVKYIKIPQTGVVRIGDDAEIGACVTIDRATVGETVIGRGTKIDNLVHIAHNVKIGEDAIIVAQVGIAGSTRVGNRVQLAGQVGLTGHIEIGDDAMVGAQSGVMNDLPGRSAHSGSPAMPHMDWLRAQSVFARLPELKKKIDELEKKIIELDKKP